MQSTNRKIKRGTAVPYENSLTNRVEVLRVSKRGLGCRSKAKVPVRVDGRTVSYAIPS